MATLHAIGGTIDIDMRFGNLIDHAAQSVPTNASEYSWTTTSGNLIHAFSFDDDITFNAVAPLGGGVHALQVVNSYVVGGVVGSLVPMASGNVENYWRPILAADTTIFASSLADFYGAGDFVNVRPGETLGGSNDLFEGAPRPAGGGPTIQTFLGDADVVEDKGRLTGGADTINMRTDGLISGDVNMVSGRLTGGSDTIVVEGPIASPNTRVTGDVVFVSDLEQAIAPTVIGGSDTITVKQYNGGAISGDILDAFNAALGTTTGGRDTIDASANPFVVLLYGDVQNLGNHAVKGGNDTLIGSGTVGSLLTGDAGLVSGGSLLVGADKLTGGEGRDFLFGDFVNQTGGVISIGGTFTGDDTLYGAGGDDNMQGQLGDDVLDGGMGDDFMDGGSQTAGVGDIVAFNTLNVAVSADLVLGFAFGQGNDILAGFESIRGSNRADNLAGDNLANRVEGLDGNDQIFGRGGNDTLLGGKNNDTIKGGVGNDTINGGANADTMQGNGGADTFLYANVSESGTVAATRDLIQGFTLGAGGDRIDVSAIDAQTGTVGNQAFAFIGNAAFSAEGQIRFDVVGGHTIIELNTTGVAGAEMGVDLAGAFPGLTGASFVP
ncbi:hypothetical protein BH10PSE6_BH10PSE6_43200 [soil metagenome]